MLSISVRGCGVSISCFSELFLMLLWNMLFSVSSMVSSMVISIMLLVICCSRVFFGLSVNGNSVVMISVYSIGIVMLLWWC